MAAKRPVATLKGPLGEALRAVAGALRQLPVSGMLIGGMAVIARGLARIRRTIDEFAQAIEEPERLAAFERIVKTVLG